MDAFCFNFALPLAPFACVVFTFGVKYRQGFTARVVAAGGGLSVGPLLVDLPKGA